MTLCVFFLQLRVFGSRQASGQGVCGLLYPGGHSLRRTPRRGKKLSCTTQIIGCLYFFSCFISSVELGGCWDGSEILHSEMPQTTAVALCEGILEAIFENVYVSFH